MLTKSHVWCFSSQFTIAGVKLRRDTIEADSGPQQGVQPQIQVQYQDSETNKYHIERSEHPQWARGKFQLARSQPWWQKKWTRVHTRGSSNSFQWELNNNVSLNQEFSVGVSHGQLLIFLYWFKVGWAWASWPPSCLLTWARAGPYHQLVLLHLTVTILIVI